MIQESLILLLQRYKSPQNIGPIKDADLELEGNNAACGDHVTLYIQLDEKKNILQARFESRACIIATASTDIFCQFIQGKSLDMVNQMKLNQLLEHIPVKIPHNRIPCASLALDIFKNKEIILN